MDERVLAAEGSHVLLQYNTQYTHVLVASKDFC